MIFYILAIAVSIAFLAADQISKYLIAANFSLGATGTIIPKLFDFRYIYNTGGAWGMLSGKTWLLVAVTATVIIAAVIWLILKGRKNKWLFASVCLILSGGTGNMIDRIFRGGKVVDFIEFAFWKSFPVFNIADIAIVIGCGGLIAYLLLDIIKDYRNKDNKNDAD